MSDEVPGAPAAPDPWRALASLTPARIGLGRAGSSLPTRPLLEFQLAHARARDAVHCELDDVALAAALASGGREVLRLHAAARDRAEFIARPDRGRILDDASRRRLEARSAPAEPWDCVFVVADGLSARAVEAHAVPLLEQVIPGLEAGGWRVGPVAVVRQGRVAVGDEIGALLGARMCVLLVGERPGLSSPDSLGAYLTWDPLPGRSNAERNCISNIRPPEGLPYEVAARTLCYLMGESRRLQLSGVALKDDAPADRLAG